MYMQFDVIGGSAEQIDRMITNAMALPESIAPDIIEDFHRMETKRFNESGSGWAPLSETTIQLKQAAGYTDPERPMVATGALRDALTSDADGSVIDVTEDSITVGTNLPYAKFHQSGPRQIRVFGRGSATLPRRRLVEMTPEDGRRWAETLKRALMAGVEPEE